jgi:uroporphyrinogen decarboxylase
MADDESIGIKPEHKRIAADLTAEMHRRDGLAPVDIDRFYADQAVAIKDPFGRDIPQCPLGISWMKHCVFAELGIAENPARPGKDDDWRLALNKAYNDKAEKIVGRRFPSVSENRADPLKAHPACKTLDDIFEGRNVWKGGTLWLEQSAHNEDELKALLDRVESRLDKLREFVLSPDWEEGKARLNRQGRKTRLYRYQRGPVTFAMSIYGVENLVFLICDNPALAGRFRDLILLAMLGLGRALDDEAGFTPEKAPHGFKFSDDDCALLTPDMYEFFGYPVVKGVFDRYCPNPGDLRAQHSDSEMEHLLPLLGKLEFNDVNFGPTVMVDKIREHLPRAVIRGALAPFTFSRNEEENIAAEFLRDFEMAREKRGLIFETAGGINNGSRLTGLRLIMAAIQKYGRYDAG